MLAAMVAMVEMLAVKAGAMVEVGSAAAIRVRIKARWLLQIPEVKTGIIIDRQKCGALFAPFFI